MKAGTSGCPGLYSGNLQNGRLREKERPVECGSGRCGLNWTLPAVGGAIVEQADRTARHYLGPAGQLAEQPSRRRQPQWLVQGQFLGVADLSRIKPGTSPGHLHRAALPRLQRWSLVGWAGAPRDMPGSIHPLSRSDVHSAPLDIQIQTLQAHLCRLIARE